MRSRIFVLLSLMLISPVAYSQDVAISFQGSTTVQTEVTVGTGIHQTITVRTGNTPIVPRTVSSRPQRKTRHEKKPQEKPQEKPKFKKDPNTYYNSDAALANLKTSGLLFAGSIASGAAAALVPTITRQVLHSETVRPSTLSEAEIQKIVSRAERSIGATAGLGEAGGAVVRIEYDNGQNMRNMQSENMGRTLNKAPIQQMANAQNAFGGGGLREGGLVQDIRTGKTPDVGAINKGLNTLSEVEPDFRVRWIRLRDTKITGLEEQLRLMASEGTIVKDVRMTPFLGRLTNGGLKTTAVVLAVAGAEHLGLSAIQGLDSDSEYCGKTEECVYTGFVKSLADSGVDDSLKFKKKVAAQGARN